MKKIATLIIITMYSSVNASTYTDRNGRLLTEDYSNGKYNRTITTLCEGCGKTLREDVTSDCGSNSGTFYMGHESCRIIHSVKSELAYKSQLMDLERKIDLENSKSSQKNYFDTLSSLKKSELSAFIDSSKSMKFAVSHTEELSLPPINFDPIDFSTLLERTLPTVNFEHIDLTTLVYKTKE
jgi:hypothetical protein